MTDPPHPLQLQPAEDAQNAEAAGITSTVSNVNSAQQPSVLHLGSASKDAVDGNDGSPLESSHNLVAATSAVWGSDTVPSAPVAEPATGSITATAQDVLQSSAVSHRSNRVADAAGRQPLFVSVQDMILKAVPAGALQDKLLQDFDPSWGRKQGLLWLCQRLADLMRQARSEGAPPSAKMIHCLLDLSQNVKEALSLLVQHVEEYAKQQKQQKNRRHHHHQHHHQEHKKHHRQQQYEMPAEVLVTTVEGQSPVATALAARGAQTAAGPMHGPRRAPKPAAACSECLPLHPPHRQDAAKMVTQPPAASASNLDAKFECLFCMDAERSVVLLPCKHIVYCYDCAAFCKPGGTNCCPLCRLPVQDQLQVLWS